MAIHNKNMLLKFLLHIPQNTLKSILLFINNFKSLLPLNLPRINTHYIFDFIDSHVFHYPTPISLTYAWSFGSLAGFSLVIQIISGVVLSMYYVPHIDYAFSSIEFIMRDVRNGWLIRYIHSNGASMFFIVVYAHMCRGLYYGSYMRPREALWCSGVVLFLLMMATAFTGYVLPWGQMSFWGATVVTSMVTIVPFGGQSIAHWLWGGYIVGNYTLKRFYSIHFLLPFIIAGVSLLHLALLHRVGSNSPIGSDTGVDDVPFYPYFFSKDTFALAIYLLVFATLVFYFPNTLNNPDNYIPADPIHTPAHMVPEWYFLPYFTILRSIPHKALGILTMGGSVLVLFLIPFNNTSYIRNTTYRPIFKIVFWIFVADFVLLTWIGQKPLKNTYIFAGQIATAYYFLFFLILIPVIGKVETFLVHYKLNNIYYSTWFFYSALKLLIEFFRGVFRDLLKDPIILSMYSACYILMLFVVDMLKLLSLFFLALCSKIYFYGIWLVIFVQENAPKLKKYFRPALGILVAVILLVVSLFTIGHS